MKDLFGAITNNETKAGLKNTETIDKSVLDIEAEKKRIETTKKIREVTGINNEDERRNYFFDSGVDGWYESLKDHTFATTFLDLTKKEATCIHNIFFNIKDEKYDKSVLKNLEKRLDECIKTNHESKAFIKLSTRSPKDSTAAYRLAKSKYKEIEKSKMTENDRYICFSELMRQGCKVTNGLEAIELLTTSKRVAEDIKYLYEGMKETKDDNETLDLKLVVRSFDDTVVAATEFRGFVWNSKFVCVTQYFHQLYFEELQGKENQVAKDLQDFFKVIQDNIKIPCYMMDLTWFGDERKPMLVEVNPFDGEGLGAFPASTGLFDWYDDRKVMTGEVEFEVRIRKELPTINEMKNVNPDWAKLVLA